jgi:hypothetical protein
VAGELTANKYHIGPCTLVVGGNTLEYAEEAEVTIDPTVIEFPDPASSGTLGYVVTNRKITVKVKMKQISLDNFEYMSGYYGSRGQAGSAQWVNLDDAKHLLPEGSLTLMGTLLDGTPITLFLKRVQAVPTSTTSVFSPREATQWTCAYVKVAPADGTTVAGRFMLGDMS